VEHECTVAYVNFTTQGVLSTAKMQFALHQITTLAHGNTKSFMAVVVLPNRAGDLRSGVKPGTKPQTKIHNSSAKQSSTYV